MKKRIAIVALCLAVALVGLATVSGCSAKKDTSLSKVQEAGVIVNGLNAEFQPFEYVDESGKFAGFDVDLANAIGEILGVTVQTQDFAFDGLIPALQARKVDMVLSALTILPDRAEKVDFSQPYFTAVLSIVVREGETRISDVASLNGLKVGVQLGTTGDIVATEAGNIEVVRFQLMATAFIELKNGNVDAVIIDKPYAGLYAAENPGFTVLDCDDFVKEEYGICVAKGDKALLDAINAALDELKANGKFDEIYRKWFEVK